MVFENKGISVLRRSSDLLVHNATTIDVAVTAFDDDGAPLDVTPSCVPPERECLNLPAGSDLSVPYAAVHGNDGRGNIVVYAWTIAAGFNGFFWNQAARVVVVR